MMTDEAGVEPEGGQARSLEELSCSYSSDQYDLESHGESGATENETADGDSDNHNSGNSPVVKVKTLVEYHLEFLTKHPGEVFFYGCKLCTHRFTSRNSFLIHMKLHNVRKRYPCDFCDKAFDRKFQLVHHLRLHTEETPFECEVCFVAFATEPELVEHSQVHTSDKPFECRYCLKGFPQKKALIVHLRMHTGERPFPCQFCDRTFTQKAHLQGHMVRIHIPKKVDYKSDEMQSAADKSIMNIFAQSNAAERLLNSMKAADGSLMDATDLSMLSAPREKLIECDFCDKKFTYERNKTNHMKKHGTEAMYECEICQKTFPTKSTLSTHLLTHNNTSSSPFRCEICHREFNMKRNLIMHVKSHNNERPFECPACEKSFKLKYFLELHISRIHPDINIDEFQNSLKKEVPVDLVIEKENAVNYTTTTITPNKRKQSQPKKVVVNNDGYETDTDESEEMEDFSSDEERDGEVPFDAAKFVKVFIQEPKNLSTKDDGTMIGKSMQINLPHDLQHVKKLLNAPKHPQLLAPPLQNNSEQPKPVSCPLCSVTVPNKALLMIHLKEHDKNKPHQCTMCEKVYIQQASFEKHLRKHMLDDIAAKQTKMLEQVSFQSNLMPKDERLLLDQPYRAHEGKKPLECKICRKKYAQPASFEKHMKQHMEMGEVAPGDLAATISSAFEKLDNKITRSVLVETDTRNTTEAGSGVGGYINPSDFLEVSMEHS